MFTICRQIYRRELLPIFNYINSSRHILIQLNFYKLRNVDTHFTLYKFISLCFSEATTCLTTGEQKCLLCNYIYIYCNNTTLCTQTFYEHTRYILTILM